MCLRSVRRPCDLYVVTQRIRTNASYGFHVRYFLLCFCVRKSNSVLGGRRGTAQKLLSRKFDWIRQSSTKLHQSRLILFFCPGISSHRRFTRRKPYPPNSVMSFISVLELVHATSMEIAFHDHVTATAPNVHVPKFFAPSRVAWYFECRLTCVMGITTRLCCTGR